MHSMHSSGPRGDQDHPWGRCCASNACAGVLSRTHGVQAGGQGQTPLGGRRGKPSTHHSPLGPQHLRSPEGSKTALVGRQRQHIAHGCPIGAGDVTTPATHQKAQVQGGCTKKGLYGVEIVVRGVQTWALAADPLPQCSRHSWWHPDDRASSLLCLCLCMCLPLWLWCRMGQDL